MILEPDAIVELSHSASLWAGEGFWLAAAASGSFSVIGSDYTIRQTGVLPRFRRIAVHPHRPLVALVETNSGNVLVEDLAGAQLAQIPAPELERIDDWVAPGFTACHFDRTGQWLWLTAKAGTGYGHRELHLIDTESWSAAEISSSEGYEHFEGLFAAPWPNCDMLFEATPAELPCASWIRINAGRIGCEFVPWIKSFPYFSPGGTQFLTLGNGELRKYEVGSLEQVGDAVSTYLLKEDPNEYETDDPLTDVAFLSDSSALAKTDCGRIYAIDIERMLIQGEVIIPGHELQPVNKLLSSQAFPNTLMGTDIISLDRVGDAVVLVCPEFTLRGSRVSVRWFRA